MPRFAANLTLMYPELPFLDRFEAAARDGFKAVEFLFPYAFSVTDLAARLQHNGLQQALFNTPPGGTDSASFNAAWDLGHRGTASVPGHEAEFRAGFEQALNCALVLDCPRIHAMVGLRAEGCSPEAADATLVTNLQWAAAQAAQAGRDVLIEPINRRSVPGFHLNRQDHAHRHEPGTGEVNWAHIFQVIDKVSAECGWDGWVGCEYNPADASAGGTSRGLGWARPYL